MASHHALPQHHALASCHFTNDPRVGGERAVAPLRLGLNHGVLDLKQQQAYKGHGDVHRTMLMTLPFVEFG
eukprot:1161471-Pelagomonas_calceolata.AAC.7